MKKGLIGVFVFILMFSLVIGEDNENNFLDDEIIDVQFELPENLEFSCDLVKGLLEGAILNMELPKQVPFTNEVFNVYLDEMFVVSVYLENKKVTHLECEEADATYNVFVAKSIFLDALKGEEEINPIDFYNEKRASGELQIKAVGFSRSLKMGFINFGLRIASWFS